jgi:hypothetical protein
MDVELTPEQPAAVERAVADLLAGVEPGPDPWWQSGNQEALET